MYLMVTRYKLKPGRELDLIARAKAIDDDLAQSCATSMHTVRLGDDRYMTIALYTNQNQAETALRIAKEIWSSLADLIHLETMQVEAGEVICTYGGSDALQPSTPPVSLDR
jgi:hypothetical protein